MDSSAVVESAVKVTVVGAGPERKSPVGRTLTLTSSSCERPPTRSNVKTAVLALGDGVRRHERHQRVVVPDRHRRRGGNSTGVAAITHEGYRDYAVGFPDNVVDGPDGDGGSSLVR